MKNVTSSKASSLINSVQNSVSIVKLLIKSAIYVKKRLMLLIEIQKIDIDLCQRFLKNPLRQKKV